MSDPHLDVLLLKVPRLNGGVEEVLGQSLFFFSISNPFLQIEQSIKGYSGTFAAEMRSLG